MSKRSKVVWQRQASPKKDEKCGSANWKTIGHSLKGQLIQTDGLHMQVASAQAEVTGLADHIDDLQITVDAYRLLAESLNDAREAQVRRGYRPNRLPGHEVVQSTRAY